MDQKIGYREFQASANSHKIQCEHHLVAILFVCGKFLVAGRQRCRPLRVCGDNLLKFKAFAVPFRFRAELAERSNLRAAETV